MRRHTGGVRSPFDRHGPLLVVLVGAAFFALQAVVGAMWALILAVSAIVVLLIEDALDQATQKRPSFLLTENGGFLLTEAGDRLLLEGKSAAVSSLRGDLTLA